MRGINGGGREGFVLLTALVLGLAIAVIGTAGLVISHADYRAVKAQKNFYSAQERAETGVKEAVSRLVSGSATCESLNGMSLDGVTVRTVKAGNTCFIWSEGRYQLARSVQVSAVTLGGSSEYGAVVLRELSNLSIRGMSSIISCDEDCVSPALVIGNDLRNEPRMNSECSGMLRGLASLTDPLLENVSFGEGDIPSMVFNGVSSRQDLLNLLERTFGVDLDDGTPVGLVGSVTQVTDTNGTPTVTEGNFDVCLAYHNNCTAQEDTIDCSTVTYRWTGSSFMATYISGGNTYTFYCNALNLGPNSSLTIFSFDPEDDDDGSRPRIFANNIVINPGGGGGDDDEDVEHVILAARNSIQATQPHTEIEDSALFSQNITIEGPNIEIEETLIYSGGAGVGNLTLSNIAGDSEIGEDEEGVIIISDNNLNIQGRGHGEINGLIYVTSENNNFSISARGMFRINGAVISNSTRNNNIDMRGHVQISFDPEVIEGISEEVFSAVRPPQCGGTDSVRVPLVLHSVRVY